MALTTMLIVAQCIPWLHWVQAGDGEVVQEVGAVPGPWPGIWSCDYKNLSMIYVHTATASVALQRENLQLAEV